MNHYRVRVFFRHGGHTESSCGADSFGQACALISNELENKDIIKFEIIDE